MMTNKAICEIEAQKITDVLDSKVLKTKNRRTMLLSKCAVCSTKQSRFLKEQEAKEIYVV